MPLLKGRCFETKPSLPIVSGHDSKSSFNEHLALTVDRPHKAAFAEPALQ
jgi:hypothetical protein